MNALDASDFNQLCLELLALAVGDRVVELPGLPSQRCGTIICFAEPAHLRGSGLLFPIVLGFAVGCRRDRDRCLNIHA